MHLAELAAVSRVALALVALALPVVAAHPGPLVAALVGAEHCHHHHLLLTRHTFSHPPWRAGAGVPGPAARAAAGGGAHGRGVGLATHLDISALYLFTRYLQYIYDIY